MRPLLDLTMQEIKKFNEQRAEIYWWFSSLFSKELTDEELKAYQSQQVRGFLQGLSENEELKKATDGVIESLNKLQDREDAQLELSADFCELFLTSDKHAALPYASIYLDDSKLLNGKPAQEMAALMQEKGIQLIRTSTSRRITLLSSSTFSEISSSAQTSLSKKPIWR